MSFFTGYIAELNDLLILRIFRMNIIKTSLLLSLLAASLISNVASAANRSVGNLENSVNKHDFQFSISTKDPENSYSLALQFVKSSSLHKSLSLLLLDSVKNDAFIEKAISRHGFETVKSSVVVHIKGTTSLYRSQWEELMAAIYSDQFDQKVLKSILEEGEKSPHMPRFINVQHEANTSHALTESDLFKEARQNLINSLKLNLTAMVH